MRPTVVFGAGEIAQLAFFYFEDQRRDSVSAFVVDDVYRHSDTFCGLPLVGLSQLGTTYPPSHYDAFVAISYREVNRVRESKYRLLKKLGYNFRSYVSPHCTCLSRDIGENCFVLEDNTIQPFVKLGDNVTLWSGNHIGHHSRIGDHCFISSHVVISGGVVVEENCFIGVNATLRDHIRIARETVIGAGAVVLADTAPRQVLMGHAAGVSSKTSDQLRSI